MLSQNLHHLVLEKIIEYYSGVVTTVPSKSFQIGTALKKRRVSIMMVVMVMMVMITVMVMYLCDGFDCRDCKTLPSEIEILQIVQISYCCF